LIREPCAAGTISIFVIPTQYCHPEVLVLRPVSFGIHARS
jgi:hypothetical protein